LEPGVEGLVHISELSHKRVFRVSDVVSEGQEVETKVLSVDPEAQRMSLSMKALEARAEPQAAANESAAEEEPTPPKKPAKRAVPLKGGLGRHEPGDPHGLRW
jgi:small subunit ribosomal protein S1